MAGGIDKFYGLQKTVVNMEYKKILDNKVQNVFGEEDKISIARLMIKDKSIYNAIEKLGDEKFNYLISLDDDSKTISQGEYKTLITLLDAELGSNNEYEFDADFDNINIYKNALINLKNNDIKSLYKKLARKLNIEFLPTILQKFAVSYSKNGDITSDKEMTKFKDFCLSKGYKEQYINNCINVAIAAQNDLDKFLSTRNKSQYSEVVECGTGIDVKDEGIIKDFPDIAKVMPECDKDNSGYIELGKELANFFKKLAEMGKPYYSFWNGDNEGLSNIEVSSTSDKSGAYHATQYRLTYLVDNNTGERVLYQRYIHSEEWDENGNGHPDVITL